jgi:hypothetical protein
VKKIAVAVALCCGLACSPVQAKTFIGVLWPMFGPTAAIGLVELVAELKLMPDVEVSTYLHQSWPALVKDLDSQPPGTHTIGVGYSLGANSSVFVANNAKHIDLIVALQPSMLSWNPAIKGNVGRVVEIYNPDPWMTFGGMGSKKLVGGHIEYIANRDSHPGAQFNWEFRNLVKSEIAKFAAADRGEIAQAQIGQPRKLAQLSPSAPPASKEERGTRERKDMKATGLPKTAQIEAPVSPQRAKPDGAPGAKPDGVAEESQKQQRKELTAFLDKLSGSVQSGYLFSERPLTLADQPPLEIDDQRPLTIADMRDYAERTYRHIVTASY